MPHTGRCLYVFTQVDAWADATGCTGISGQAFSLARGALRKVYTFGLDVVNGSKLHQRNRHMRLYSRACICEAHRSDEQDYDDGSVASRTLVFSRT